MNTNTWDQLLDCLMFWVNPISILWFFSSSAVLAFQLFCASPTFGPLNTRQPSCPSTYLLVHTLVPQRQFPFLPTGSLSLTQVVPILGYLYFSFMGLVPVVCKRWGDYLSPMVKVFTIAEMPAFCSPLCLHLLEQIPSEVFVESSEEVTREMGCSGECWWIRNWRWLNWHRRQPVLG